MIFFNGTNGSLARYFAVASHPDSIAATPIRSRLEDPIGFRNELKTLIGPRATFIHFAAKVSVPWCEKHPEETRKTNVEDTLSASRTFVEECRARGIEPNFVYVSSAHLYARSESAIHESDPVLPRSVYARSKLEAENRLRDFAEREGVSLRIARVFGLVAPVQPDHYVLHALLRRAREGAVRDIPGLSNERDYLDSRDVCRAIADLTALDETKFARVCPDRILNIGSGHGATIRSIAEKCIRATRSLPEAESLIASLTEAPSRPDDVPRIVASIEHYRSLFSKEPRTISLDETIRDAVAAKRSAT